MCNYFTEMYVERPDKLYFAALGCKVKFHHEQTQPLKRGMLNVVVDWTFFEVFSLSDKGATYHPFSIVS